MSRRLRMQPLHPASIKLVKSLLRIRFVNAFNVLADLSVVASFSETQRVSPISSSAIFRSREIWLSLVVCGSLITTNVTNTLFVPYLFYKEKFITQFKTREKMAIYLHGEVHWATKKKRPFLSLSQWRPAHVVLRFSHSFRGKETARSLEHEKLKLLSTCIGLTSAFSTTETTISIKDSSKLTRPQSSQT